MPKFGALSNLGCRRRYLSGNEIVSNYLSLVESIMKDVLSSNEQTTADIFGNDDLSLYGMARYHLGWSTSDFKPAQYDAGKRIRPLICMYACGAVGGAVGTAAPAAAAIEFLHNFTLVHDDIQDQSDTRRHRPTVWAEWGTSQAINAGDAMFALGQLALLRSVEYGLPYDRLELLARGYNQVTLRIVEGQVLDLGFEDRWNISVDNYVEMIRGKTAAIVAYAAWAGALVGGADFDRAEQFRAFGEALGLGFQVQDDVLGIWGETDVTGKRKADDIRRRKKSLPIISLASAASSDELDRLREIYQQTSLEETDVNWVVELLRRYEIQDTLQDVVARYHDDARFLIERAVEDSPSRQALLELLERLSTRTF
jgi:geranylgeranyl diphosphate synthase type I